MYNIDNFNTSFNRTLRSYNVKKKTNDFYSRRIVTTYSIYDIEITITSDYTDSKLLVSYFTFAFTSQVKHDSNNPHRLSNNTISRFKQREQNNRVIGTDPLVNRFSQSQLEQFHSVALIASQHLVVTTIESYIENFFNDVNSENELHAINSQFNSLSEFSRNQFIKNFVSSDSSLLTTGGNN